MATNTIKTVHAGVDVPYNLPTTSADWTEDSNNNFVHTYTDSRITPGCRIEITFKTGTLNTEIPYVEFEKGTGSIDFTVSSIPTVAIPIIIHIINSQSGNVQAVLATDVATSGDAQTIGVNVNSALISLNDQITAMFVEQNITIPNMNASSSTTITVTDWSYAKPFVCQARESIGARSFTITNWWLSGTTLYLVVHNNETTSVTGGTFPCSFIIPQV